MSYSPGNLTVENIHLTDIPTGEEASSLSAILLDEDYYSFTLANTTLTAGLHYANDPALIVLKAKAFLNNLSRKNAGQQVYQEDILKHKRDVTLQQILDRLESTFVCNKKT